jgi:hypothetical protein
MAREGRAPHEHLIAYDGGGVEVALRAYLLPPDLFGRHVLRSADFARPDDDRPFPGLGNPEVDHDSLPVGREQDVAGLDVAVDDRVPEVMGVVESGANLLHDAGD